MGGSEDRLQSPGDGRQVQGHLSGLLAARPTSRVYCFPGGPATQPTRTPGSQRARIPGDLESESCFPKTRSNLVVSCKIKLVNHSQYFLKNT